MDPLQDDFGVQDGHRDVYCGRAMSFSSAERASLTHFVQVVDSCPNDKSREVLACSHDKLVCEFEDVVASLDLTFSSGREYFVHLIRWDSLLLLAQSVLEEQELVNDSWPIHGEAEVAILFSLNLLVHERASIFK